MYGAIKARGNRTALPTSMVAFIGYRRLIR
jgi:hypothetical protein